MRTGEKAILKLAGYKVRFDEEHEAWEWVNYDKKKVSVSWMDTEHTAWEDALRDFKFDMMEAYYNEVPREADAHL